MTASKRAGGDEGTDFSLSPYKPKAFGEPKQRRQHPKETKRWQKK
jgi:hypothetical protein